MPHHLSLRTGSLLFLSLSPERIFTRFSFSDTHFNPLLSTSFLLSLTPFLLSFPFSPVLHSPSSFFSSFSVTRHVTGVLELILELIYLFLPAAVISCLLMSSSVAQHARLRPIQPCLPHPLLDGLFFYFV